MPSNTDETYLAVIHKMDLESLRNAMNLLTSDEQLLIDLYYFEDYSMEKIAGHFGVSKMAISKRHKKVTNKLKELMAA